MNTCQHDANVVKNNLNQLIQKASPPRRQVADANWPPPYAPHPPTIISILRVPYEQAAALPTQAICLKLEMQAWSCLHAIWLI